MSWTDSLRSSWQSLVTETNLLYILAQDELVLAAGRFLGVESLSLLAEQAEAKENCWAAAKLRSLQCTIIGFQLAAAIEPTVKCMEACNGVNLAHESSLVSSSDDRIVDLEDMKLETVARITLQFNYAYLFPRTSMIEAARESNAGKRNPVAAATVGFLPAVAASMATDLVRLHNIYWNLARDAYVHGKSHPDPAIADEAMTFSFTCLGVFLLNMNSCPEFDYTICEFPPSLASRICWAANFQNWFSEIVATSSRSTVNRRLGPSLQF